MPELQQPTERGVKVVDPSDNGPHPDAAHWSRRLPRGQRILEPVDDPFLHVLVPGGHLARADRRQRRSGVVRVTAHRRPTRCLEERATVAGFDAALTYAGRRRQFGRTLAHFQIVQQRLVHMLADVRCGCTACRSPASPSPSRLTDTLAGLAKLHNTGKARAVLAEARDLLGGNGILLDFHVMRHMADIASVHTFEGTETIQTLIVGRDITGVGAFT